MLTARDVNEPELNGVGAGVKKIKNEKTSVDRLVCYQLRKRIWYITQGLLLLVVVEKLMKPSGSPTIIIKLIDLICYSLSFFFRFLFF